MSSRDRQAESHRRRMALMRMRGDISRAESRNLFWLVIAGACLVAVLVGAL